MSLELDTSPCRTPRSTSGRIPAFYNRYSPSVVQIILTRLLDALIFASAVIITACNFLAGNLDTPFAQPQPPPASSLPIRSMMRSMPSSASMPDIRHHSRYARAKRTDLATVAQQPHVRRRTQDWIGHRHKTKALSYTAASSSTDDDAFKPPPPSQTPPAHARRDKRRTQSLSHNPTTAQFLVARHKEEARFTRLEEKVYSLLEEAQAALAQKPSVGHSHSQSHNSYNS